MRSTWKRALSTILTVCMIASLLVVPASAGSSTAGNVTTYTLEAGTDVTANPTENGGKYVDGYFTVNKMGAYDNTHNYTYHSGQADEYAPKYGLKVGNATEYATGKKAIYFTTTYDNASVKVWWSPATNTGRWLRAWNDKNTSNLITDADETQTSNT